MTPRTSGFTTFLSLHCLLGLFLLLATFAAPAALHAQATASALSLGSVAVASSTTGTVTFTFSASTTVGSIVVSTEGATGLDYNLNSGAPGTCAATTYAANATCTVGVKFSPTASGWRTGAVALYGAAYNLLGIAYLSGTGLQAQAIFPGVSEVALTGPALTYPTGVSVDAAGNLYVSGFGSNSLYKLTVSGTSYTRTTVDSTLSNAVYQTTVDGAGNVLVADRGNSRVVLETLNPSTGLYTQSVLLTGLNFNQSGGIALDAGGNLYLGLQGGSVVKYTYAGGTYTPATTVLTGFSMPLFLAADAAGDLYVSDDGNGAVYKETLSGGAYTQSLVGNPSSAPLQIAVDAAGDVYVATQTDLFLYSPSGGSYSQTTLTSGGFQAMAVTAAGVAYAAIYATPTLYRLNQTAAAFTVTGTTALGSTSTEQKATLLNSGNQSLSFSSITLSGPAVKGPSTTCKTGTAVVVGASCIGGIEFAPTAHGASPQTGTMTFAGNFTSAPETITGDVTGDPTQLAITGPPASGVTAGGNAGAVTVTLEDSTGATAIYDTNAPVTLTVTYPDSTQAVYGPTNAGASVVSFNTAGHALTEAGTYTYAVTSTGLAGAATTATVVAGAEAGLAAVPATTNPYLGEPDNITVNAVDIYGNFVSSSGDTVALTSTDTNAALPANFALSGGTATEPVTFNALGTFTVTASDVTNPGIAAATTANITVQADPVYTVTTATDPGGSGTAANCSNQALPGATLDASCSLRDAFAATNALDFTGVTNAQPTINFSSSLVTANPILSISALLRPAANFNLAGPGAGSLTISPSTSGYAFVNTATASIAMTVSGLTVNGFSGSADGGAWYATGSGHLATFSNDIFTGNTATADGGAIDDSNGTVMLTDTAFTSNSAVDAGGALYLSASSLGTSASPASGNIFTGNKVTTGPSTLSGGGAIYFTGANTSYLSTSLFSGNKASGVYALGGAIHITSTTTSKPNITIIKSLFTGNTTAATSNESYGGALYQSAVSASYLSTLTLTGDTFTGNLATTAATSYDAEGGAIYTGNYVTDAFYNDTVTANTVSNTDHPAYAMGGGIDTIGITDYVPALYNTIVADNNTSLGGGYPDVNFASTPGCKNTVCSVSAGSSAVDTGSLLSALGNYGGSTIGPVGATQVLQTIVPLPGSPALAEGSTSSSYVSAGETDARGYPRLTTYNGTTHIDAGAVEANYTLDFAQEPSSTTINTVFSPMPSVQIYESGVPFTTAGGNLAISASAGTPSASSIAIAASPATLNVTFPGPELNDTLIASINNSATTPVTVASTTSTEFNITDGAATLGFGTPPPAQLLTGGNAGIVTVDELLAGGGINTTDNATVVTLKVAATGYTTATYTAAAVNGVATFNLSADALTPAGTYTYAASASTYTTDTVMATELVAADTVDHFNVSGIPSVAIPGTAYTFTVTAIDPGSATDTSFTGPVSLTSTDAAASFLLQNYTFNSGDAGVHSFTVTFATGGVQSVTATDNTGQTGSETGIHVILDYVWLVNTNGTVDKLTDSGTVVTGAVGSSGAASSLGGVAFDSSGNVWSVTSANNTLNFNNKTGTGAATYSGGGLNGPAAVAVDGAGSIWVANSGSASVSEFKSSGANQSGSLGYGASGVAAIGGSPSGVAIDNTGGVWVISKTGNSVTHLLGAATPVVTPNASAVTGTAVGTEP